jgi:UDP-glucuronate decarboxylase
MRILVTGGAGFLGSHLSERLLEMGHSVLCVDNFYTGNQKNIDHLRDNREFELMRHDVTFPLYVEVDGIFNLACPASPIHYQKNPVQTFKTSVHGAINMLGLAKRIGARFFQASTSEIYGDPTISPQPEEYWGNVNPIGIRSCYDEGKRAAETLTFDYHRQFRLDIRVARIFNTYGPRMHANDGRVVSNFIVQALKGEPITVYGDGTQTRSFCYVDDLIEGFIKLFFTERVYEPVNLGNPMPINMLDLANEVIALTGSKSKIEMRPLPGDDPKQREPLIEKAEKLLGWKPVVDRQNGLKKTIEYFRKVIN